MTSKNSVIGPSKMVIKVLLKGGRKKEGKRRKKGRRKKKKKISVFFDEVWTDGDVGRISEGSRAHIL
jgi:hypothetical protein